MNTTLVSLLVSLLTLLSSIFVPVPPVDVSFGQDSVAQVVAVIDGDTIEVIQNGEKIKVRYIGIDTPEPYRDGKPACYSHEATEANKKMVEGKKVKMIADSEDKDKYGRLLRYVYADETFVNATLLQEGFAKTLTIQPNTTYKKEFAQFQVKAKEEAKGMWGGCK
jgi:micrococcal nuclease